ncbi:hypothetical protein NMG60_11008998 [Bertholletia excelsa]
MWAIGIIAVLVAIECLEAGLNTLSKAAMTRGMSDFIFVLYSNTLALLFLLPSTFFFHRNRPCPPLSLSVIVKIFAMSIFSCSIQILLYVGIGYGSPTLASAMTDLNPAFIFILAIIARMEKLNFKAWSGQAKSIGTITSITGALIITLYKGPQIMFSAGIVLSSPLEPLLFTQSNWLLGGLLLATSSFLLAMLYILQTFVIKEYPAELMVTFICCFFVTMLSAVVVLLAERDPEAWKLKLDMQLAAIVYSAIAVIVLRSLVHIWVLHKKGPVFLSAFKPLGMVIALVMGICFLGDTLHIGSVIGAVIIALGFYSVMWGKAEEEKRVEDGRISAFGTCSHEGPLLQNKTVVA